MAPLGKNLLLLEQAASTAAAHGAQWVVTPETALQGYFFYQNDPQASIPVQPQAELVSLQQLALQKKLVLFLGCRKKTPNQEAFNSCERLALSEQNLRETNTVKIHSTG